MFHFNFYEYIPNYIIITCLPSLESADPNEDDTICVEYGSCVPSYNLIIPAKIYGIFLLRGECWAIARIADASECVILSS